MLLKLGDEIFCSIPFCYFEGFRIQKSKFWQSHIFNIYLSKQNDFPFYEQILMDDLKSYKFEKHPQLASKIEIYF